MALVRAIAGSRSGCHDPTFSLWKLLFVCCVGLPVAAWHLRRPRLDCTVADVSPTRRLIRILSRAQAQSPPVAGRLAQFCTALSLRPSCSTRLRVRALPEVQPTPLIFGAYPGGGAGTVGPAGRTAPEVPSKRLAAIRELRAPGRPFVLHIYASFSGNASLSSAEQVGAEHCGVHERRGSRSSSC